ncbi:MAG: hypothetical protein WAK48_02960 [Candidatus Acidiferrum sp.]
MDQIDLAAQIRKLRMEILVTWWVGGLLIIILAAVLLSGRIKHLNTIEATEFLLKDDAGRPIARLGRQAGGTCLALIANNSLAEAKLCAFDGSNVNSSSYLLLNDADGVSRASLSAGANTRESQHFVDSGLFILQKYLNEKFLNLSVGNNTELVIGDKAPYNLQIGVVGPFYVEPTSPVPKVTISVPNNEPVINVLDKLGHEVWSTKKK